MKKNYLLIVLAIIFLCLIGIAMYSFIQNTAGDSTKNSSSEMVRAQESQVAELSDGDVFNLTASYVEKTIDGKSHKMLAYNNSIPGPLIKVPQNAEITVNFTNDTDLNTLLHSHGVRLDNAFDGTALTQDEIQPGETFSYTVKFPDAGMYWYHPHVREDMQQELGLYGNYLVEPEDAAYWSPVNQEVALFLDDILIEKDEITFDAETADHTLMGRYGNVMLINGSEQYTMTAKQGEVIRFYVTNSANARPFNFAIKDTKLKLVGADSGAYEHDTWVDSVVLGPSERVIIEAQFTEPGNKVIQNKTPDKTTTLGTITVVDQLVEESYAQNFEELQDHQDTITSIDAFRDQLDREPDKQLRLSIDMAGGMMSMSGMGHGSHMMPDGTMMGGSMMEISEDGIEWEDDNGAMNALTTTDDILWKVVDEDTGAENEDIEWEFTQNQPVKIRIYNDPNSMHPMQHPIHFHGQRFLVTDRNGEKQDNLVWKDTVMIPAGETVDILLDTSNPGEWMAHCHIAEHLEAGMMFHFNVK